MSLLAAGSRRAEVGAGALWAAGAALAAVAALAGWPAAVAVGLLAAYLGDAGLYLPRRPRLADWLAARELASTDRAVLRESLALIAWLRVAGPPPWAVAVAVAGIAAVHLAHAGYRLVSARNAGRRRGRLAWVNLEVGDRTEGPELLPPTLPSVPGIAGPRLVLLLDLPVVAALLLSCWVPGGMVVLAGALLALAGGALVARRALARQRLISLLPTPAKENALLVAAARDHAPEVAVYFSGGPDTTYQLNVWLETIDRLHRPALIILREQHHLDTMLPTRTPVVVLPRATDVELFHLPSITVALYPTTVIKNNHMIRLTGMRHVFINHGDGDKAVTYSPLHRVFDEIWVAGQAAKDRYLTRGEGVRAEQLVAVGRPQLAHIRPGRRGGGSVGRDDRRPTVLYAPTWEGNFDNVDYSSVAPMGEQILDVLLDPSLDVRVLFKAHPATGSRLRPAAAARAAIERRVRKGASQGHQVLDGAPDALYRAFNEADVLVADISSVVADFLASRRPYLVTNPRGAPEAQYHASFPSTAAAKIVGGDPSQLRVALADALGPDSLRERRHELATYFLGEPVPDPVEAFAGEVDRAVARDGRCPEVDARTEALSDADGA